VFRGETHLFGRKIAKKSPPKRADAQHLL